MISQIVYLFTYVFLNAKMDENNQLLLAVGAAGGADTLTPITMKIILIVCLVANIIINTQ